MTAAYSYLDVYIAGVLSGRLAEDSHGGLSFEYDSEYQGVPLSLSMPVGLQRNGDRVVRPYLMGLLPDEQSTRNAIGLRYGVSPNNPFRLLGAIGLDCPGAVQVCQRGAALPSEDDRRDLTPLTDEDIEEKLAAVRRNAAAAWVDGSETEGRWSLAGCQAKFTLREQDGKWFDCSGAAASTHIVKPGVAGMNNQALVEFASMRAAAKVGLPAAEVDFRMFGSEPAVVIKRYDRVRDGKGRVLRIHQEDLCQALAVMPDAKYAEQGGPTTPQIIDLLKATGKNARENVYRFILFTFFNYLIGATDAHAKNHSVMFLSPDDVRIAPLYDVASIAPYRSLAPSKRKPLRAALSIGGENRFGMLGAKNVRKMVADCELEEVGLDSDLLCGRLATMAELVPGALREVASEALGEDFRDAEDVLTSLEDEVAQNCARVLEKM